MKISTRGRYALRFMIDLAQHNTGEFTALKDVSQRQDISIKYLEQITSLLSKFGLLQSVRGPQGGYKLSKLPSEYRVGDILRITEGSLAPIPCLDASETPCPKQPYCHTYSLWQGLDKVISDYLNGITLEDLVNKNTTPESYMYNI